MNDRVTSPANDLQHFLRLALAQVQHRISKSNGRNETHRSASLFLLKELLKEQIADENSSRPAGPTR